MIMWCMGQPPLAKPFVPMSLSSRPSTATASRWPGRLMSTESPLPPPGAARQRGARSSCCPARISCLFLACEIGGRWGSECHAFVRTLAALRAERAPPAVRATALAAWQRRWWGQLNCAVQRAVASTMVGGFWVAPPQPRDVELPLADVLDLADPPLPSRLPLISH